MSITCIVVEMFVVRFASYVVVRIPDEEKTQQKEET